jgi:NAD(P)-dependent dehydrogenase (short-subunit alcohol dehydrogenase family)
MGVTLEGKAVIVTGAGRGIGAAVATLAATLGAKVLVNDIDTDLAEAVAGQIRAGGGIAIAHPGDLSIWQTGEALAGACLGAFGAIDGLVNNAGLLRQGAIEVLTEDDLVATFRVNVLGTVACAQAAARRMTERGRGSIVNLVSGAQMGIRGLVAYGASKGAAASFTYTLAVELKDKGVRVNAVAPRAETRMAAMSKAYATSSGRVFQPFARPEEIAPTICFLLSDSAASIHGQVVRVDAGSLALLTHPAVLEPVLKVDTLSIAAVDTAFSEQLCQWQQPLGLVTRRLAE